MSGSLHNVNIAETSEPASRRVERIPADEIRFHPHSFGDPDGRLFTWNGELYRGISPEKSAFYSGLLDDEAVRSLMERGNLVRSEPAALALDGFGMVIRHRTVPFVSYPNEWCASMFKDATLAVLDLASELAKSGFILKDHHLWNVTFDASKPVYVDLTSIVPLQDGAHWPNYDKFCRYCLYPLALMAAGHDRIARHLLPDYEGVQRSETAALLSDAPRSLRKLTSYRPKHSTSQTDYLKELRDLIGQIELPVSLARKEEQPAALENTLRKLRPTSVLDIGGNIAVAGLNTVSFDTDSARVAQRYHEAREGRLPWLPLVMDFTKPTPSIGFSGHYSIAASERFRCEMVVATASTLELLLSRSLNFEQIADGLASFSTRWAVVEFAARDRRDGFIGALKKRFHQVETIPSSTFILCEL